MKIKTIIEKQEEYKRLQAQIENLEQAIKDLDKTPEIKYVNVSINANNAEMIRDDLRILLKKHLKKLKKAQEGLEV